jgi:hypothetical protein
MDGVYAAPGGASTGVSSRDHNQERAMNEQDWTSENREEGGVENDLLAPEQPKADPVPSLDIGPGPDAEAEPDGEQHRSGPAGPAADRPAAPAAPRDPFRGVTRVGWAMVAVTVLLALVVLLGWLKVNSSVNKVTCIQRAQTNFSAAITGTHLSTAAIGLARIGLHRDLNKCG